MPLGEHVATDAGIAPSSAARIESSGTHSGGVIVASGTATLEAALLKKPMVITYRMSPLSWQILRHMNYLPYVGLPNILAGKFVVPDLLQNNATPEKVTEAVLKLVADKEAANSIRREFEQIHLTLRQNTEEKAAQAILGLVG